MSFIEKVRRRKVIPWLGAYLAGGFIALEGVDQLIGYEILPALVYPIALTFYLFGIPGTLVLAWFHGEVGPQKPPKSELFLQGAMLFGAVVVSAVVVRNALLERSREEALASSGLDPRRVAVLYFEGADSDEELAVVAGGLTESLIGQLDQVRALDVISRNGVRPFRETLLARDSIARLLEAGTLVAGSVEEAGERLRVSARLIDGFSGADLDRMSVELPADELFAAQDSIAELVSRALRERIGEEVELRQRQRGTSVVEAWTLVQRATRLHAEAEDRWDAGESAEALELLARADDLLVDATTADPSWVEPLALRAHNAFRAARITLDLRGVEPADSLIDVGLERAEEALALEPNDAMALEQRGNLRYLRWLLDLTPDPAERERLLADARSDLEKAVDFDPTRATAHSSLSHLYYQVKDRLKVVLAAQKAYAEDAYLRDADLILSRLFWGHYDLAQFSDARQRCEEGHRRFSDNLDFVECQLWMMLAPTEEPDIERAWALHSRLDSLAPEELRPFYDSVGRLIVGGVIGRAGLPDSANRVLVSARASADVDPEQETVGLEAVMRSVMGDVEGAMARLQRYVAANPHHSFEVDGELHWWWRNLRDHPDFQSVISSR